MRIGAVSAIPLFLAAMLWPNFLSAQTSGEPVIYFHIPQQEIAPGSEFEMAIFVDSLLPINAFQIAIEFTPDNLEFIGFNDANSIIDVWRQRPALISRELVGFIGGTTKEFKGERGELVKLHFKALSGGAAGLGLRGSNIYLADGEATEVVTAPFYIRLNINVDAPLLILPSINDKTPPQIFTSLIKDPANTGNILFWSAEDKESGVRSALMRHFQDFKWSPWQEASNPISITRGVWLSQIKAVNGNGNESSEILLHRNLAIFLWFWLALLVLLIAYVWYNKLKNK